MQQLNVAMQRFLRELSAVSRRRNPAIMLDQASLPWFVELNRALADRVDAAGFREVLKASSLQLRQLATEIAERAEAEHPGFDTQALREAVRAAGGEARSVQPMLFPALRADEPAEALA
jgi:EAL domain-containing protein (putative c-di-GMP-specific phosphodiesterase class I)